MITLQTLEVSMSNKPTFVEVEKMFDGFGFKFNEALIDQNNKIKLKAEKEDLKELYDGMTLITA